jgi:hypothetical protein
MLFLRLVIRLPMDIMVDFAWRGKHMLGVFGGALHLDMSHQL